jgi:hypothetical protein
VNTSGLNAIAHVSYLVFVIDDLFRGFSLRLVKIKHPSSTFIEDERIARGTTSVRPGRTEASLQAPNNALRYNGQTRHTLAVRSDVPLRNHVRLPPTCLLSANGDSLQGEKQGTLSFIAFFDVCFAPLYKLFGEKSRTNKLGWSENVLEIETNAAFGRDQADILRRRKEKAPASFPKQALQVTRSQI